MTMPSPLIVDPLDLLTTLPGLPLAHVDALIAGLARPELRPTPAHDLARAQALGVRFDHDRDPATLDAALRTYRSCPYRGRARGTVGRALAMRQLQAGLIGLPVDQDQVRALIEEAGDDPTVPGSMAVLRSIADVLVAYSDDPGYDRAATLGRIAEAAAAVPPDNPLAGMAAMAKGALAIKHAGVTGSYAAPAVTAEHARALLARDDLSAQQRTLTEGMLLSADAMEASQTGRLGNATEYIASMSEVIDRLPAGDPTAEAMRTLVSGVDGTMRVEDADDPRLAPAERAWRLFMVAHQVAKPAIDRKDPAGIARGIGLMRRAAQAAPDGYQHLPMILTMLGGLLAVHCQVGGGRPALDEALRRLTTAQELAGHPGHPQWAACAMALALVHRLDGRATRGRETGRRALRGHAWSVILQAGTADAVAAARHATDDARQVARWCLADGDPAGAAVALDAGRCLMLYAATVTMDVPARLTRLGRDDLLAGWRRDPSDVDVRIEVLTALAGAPVTDASVPDVLDPPGAAEVGRALTALRADVLVYLLPRDDEGPGGAVLVPSGTLPGVRPAFLTLPRLAATDLLTRHVETLGSRDAGAVGGHRTEDWATAVDRLCDWAWPAVVGPLLDTLDRWPIGRAPRIVLVPMGDLGAVPWHAARDRDGTRAVEIATFSYAPSARLLCENADRPPVAPDAPALMVADPEGDLPDARAEAAAIRAAFLPSATLLGGADATPEAVRDWLAAGAGSVLHLACHGAVQPGVDGSYLRLAGGRRLTAHEILRTNRATGIGLVALAACTTGVPSGAYDEAFSLTTAFLAAGTRSVFGSLWPVPSEATSLLMFVAHHYLWAEGKRPVDALNHAQRWMLDPDRRVPATMPAELRDLVPSLTGDVTAWAGFTHQGR